MDRSQTQYTVPGTTTSANPLAYYDALGDQLGRCPPPAADRPLLRRLSSVGIGPSLHPSAESSLSAATLHGLRDAVPAGIKQVKADVQSLFLSEAPTHNGWLVARTGTYGTDYTGRAAVDAIGLGAPLSNLAIYPFTVTDHNLQPLTGVKRLRRPHRGRRQCDGRKRFHDGIDGQTPGNAFRSGVRDPKSWHTGKSRVSDD